MPLVDSLQIPCVHDVARNSECPISAAENRVNILIKQVGVQDAAVMMKKLDAIAAQKR